MKSWPPLLLLFAAWPVLSGTLARVQFVLIEQGQGLDVLDQRYADHPVLTLLHLVPGALFLLVAPLQFHAGIRRAVPVLHRWVGRICFACAVVSGAGVLWMVLVFPAIGGVLTQVVTFCVVGAMLVFMGYAIHAVRKGHIAAHRSAMIRAYALGLSVSTARVFIEAGEVFFGLGFMQTFVIASGLGLGLNVVLAEVILGTHRRFLHR